MVEPDGFEPPSQTLEFPQESTLYELSYDPCNVYNREKAGSSSRNDAVNADTASRRRSTAQDTNARRTGRVRTLRDVRRIKTVPYIERRHPLRRARRPWTPPGRSNGGNGPRKRLWRRSQCVRLRAKDAARNEPVHRIACRWR